MFPNDCLYQHHRVFRAHCAGKRRYRRRLASAGAHAFVEPVVRHAGRDAAWKQPAAVGHGTDRAGRQWRHRADPRAHSHLGLRPAAPEGGRAAAFADGPARLRYRRADTARSGRARHGIAVQLQARRDRAGGLRADYQGLSGNREQHMTHVLIITSRFYPEISDELSRGAKAALLMADATHEEITVPGAFEIPAALRFALFDQKYDGFIALGCVIRGETTHYDYVCTESARGLMDLAIHQEAAIGYGILTVENMEQAKVRANVKQGNKGRDAAEACLRMIEIKRRFGAEP
ncbi:MAG: 6,7-dimethyl-8-ribityllumazine synthase [Pseudomonadota bacterium]|nr:6,7-dimethyl-8-ribityllumazine synthase [Pseudomonadota bacterium]